MKTLAILTLLVVPGAMLLGLHSLWAYFTGKDLS